LCCCVYDSVYDFVISGPQCLIFDVIPFSLSPILFFIIPSNQEIEPKTAEEGKRNKLQTTKLFKAKDNQTQTRSNNTTSIRQPTTANQHHSHISTTKQ
jgi:hypothetical protein